MFERRAIPILGTALLLAGTWGPSHGPEGGLITAIAVDPKHSDTIYAGALAGGFYRSTNRGESWQPLAVDPAAAVRGALALDPRRPHTIYVGSGRGVFKSTDGGRTWRSRSVGLLPKLPARSRGWRLAEGWVTQLLFAGRTLYAATYGGVFKTTDGGTTWRDSNAGLPSSGPGRLGIRRLISTLAHDPRRPRVLYGGRSYWGPGGAAVFKTTDSGRHWHRTGLLGVDGIDALAVDPRHSGVVYAARADGLFKSPDGGANWGVVLSHETHSLTFAGGKLYAGTADGLYQTDDGGETWQVDRLGDNAPPSIASLATDPRTPRTVYAGTEDGVYRSSGDRSGWRVVNTGLRASLVATLASNPGHAGTLYASVSGGGVFRSDDHAHSWRAGVSRPSRYVRALAVDPQHADVVYAGAGGAVFRSVDSGTTWRSSALRGDDVSSIAVHANVVYAGTYRYEGDAHGDVFRSDDEGATWRSTGLHQNITVLAIDPLDPHIVYAGTDRGLYRSRDGGSWAGVGAGMLSKNDDSSVAAVWSLVLATQQRLYVITPRALFESTDAAASWHVISRRVPRLGTALIVDPRRPDVFYLGGSAGVWRSVDSGRSWKPFASGLHGHGVGSLVLDADSRTLYAGSNGAGVFGLGLEEGSR